MKRSGIVTLLTDFGTKDPYVSMMKGVMLSIDPCLNLIDQTHEIPPGNIKHASGFIIDTYSFFPEGTIHLAVIDPGVGTNRRPIAVKADGHLFVGPDNGLFWSVIDRFKGCKIVHLTREEFFLKDISMTFHGRDIFAPVCAHVSKGISIDRMGELITDPIELNISRPLIQNGVLIGEIDHIDHFGNIITNILQSDIRSFIGNYMFEVMVNDHTIESFVQTYSKASPDEPSALYSSSGRLEITVKQGSCSDLLGIDPENQMDYEVRVLIKR